MVGGVWNVTYPLEYCVFGDDMLGREIWQDLDLDVMLDEWIFNLLWMLQKVIARRPSNTLGCERDYITINSHFGDVDVGRTPKYQSRIWTPNPRGSCTNFTCQACLTLQNRTARVQVVAPSPKYHPCQPTNRIAPPAAVQAWEVAQRSKVTR